MALVQSCKYVLYLTHSPQIFRIAYCDYFDPAKAEECHEICQAFLTAVRQCQPDVLNKQKVHILLHLVDCMKDFGPTCSFNSERYVH